MGTGRSNRDVWQCIDLRTLGFDVVNDIFAENAWYFRNSLIRANYNDISFQKAAIRRRDIYGDSVDFEDGTDQDTDQDTDQV